MNLEELWSITKKNLKSIIQNERAKVLKESIDKYFDYLKEQILKIDADILVCCGSQNDNNIILNTVYDIYKDEFGYVNCGKSSGMHYNKKRNKLAIDATYGRRTRSVLIMDSGYVVLSAIQPETIAGRVNTNGISIDEESKKEE